MPKRLIKPLVVWTLILFGLAAVTVQAQGDKVEVVHKGKVISISVNALPAHRALPRAASHCMRPRASRPTIGPAWSACAATFPDLPWRRDDCRSSMTTG